MNIAQDPHQILAGDAYETRIVKCSRCGCIMPAAPFPKSNQDQNPIYRPRCGSCGSMLTFPIAADNPSIGGGKYEQECKHAREDCKAEGIILCVFGGKHGSGFSVAAPQHVCLNLPSILRGIADAIESSMK